MILAPYLRTSTDDQERRGTIDNQKALIAAYAERCGHTIYDWYLDDGVSGTIPFENRPEGARLLRDAPHFQAVVLCWQDRLGRTLLGQLIAIAQLTARGISLLSATETLDTQTPDGRFMSNIRGSVAEFDRERILERMSAGRARVAALGKHPGGLLPIGYRSEKGEIIIDEPGAAVVRRIYQLYLEGLSCRSVAIRMNAERIPTANHFIGRRSRYGMPGIWHQGTIMKILHNEIYRGTYQYGDYSPVSCPPIIDQDTWEQVQSQSRQNSLLSRRNSRHTYLLKSLIRCGICGKRYVGASGGGWQGKRLYVCGGRIYPWHCKGRAVLADKLENEVWAQLVGYVREPGKLIEQLAREQPGSLDYQVDIDSLTDAIDSLDAETDRLITLYLKGTITESQLEAQKKRIAGERTALSAQRDDLVAKVVAEKNRETTLMTVEAVLIGLRDAIEHITDDKRAEVIRALVSAVVIRERAEVIISGIESLSHQVLSHNTTNKI